MSMNQNQPKEHAIMNTVQRKSQTKGTNVDLTEIQLSDVDQNDSLSELGSNIKSVTFPTKRTTRNTTRRRRLNLNK